ncbi:sterol desaturase family protein [Algoriphagus sp. AGSA1]|uniref:sterol desaturase family protein n=1 Tax=Algoriphagus sp. AGSA1 TaxID=2907213 RepID=UPI001F44C46F|nr:sterol desaturase family protein [Algoriphagus sp. AGSA1]MCE7055977.1 sterol desaturase family protein [Algoriphagus sp. AGSA1]
MKKIGRLDKPDNFGTAQMFSNPILERITRTPIWMPIAMFIILGCTSVYFGIQKTDVGVGTAILLFVTGYIGFTFVEYMMHKHFFHMEPNTPIKDKLQYTVHGVHHDYPKDKDRLAMPPFVSAAYAAILYLIFKLIMGDLAFYFLPGFLFGYALYLGIHYLVHALQPPKNFMKVLWIHHAIHHYKDPDVAFGVSTPLWDYILGTVPKRD